MEITSATVGLPVSNLQQSTEWYQRILGLESTDLEPVDGVVEWGLGPFWLQIYEQEQASGGSDDGRVAVRLGVDDVLAERERLVGLGVDVTDPVRVEGQLEFVDFHDPDGHLLTLYTMLDS